MVFPIVSWLRHYNVRRDLTVRLWGSETSHCISAATLPCMHIVRACMQVLQSTCCMWNMLRGNLSALDIEVNGKYTDPTYVLLHSTSMTDTYCKGGPPHKLLRYKQYSAAR